MRNRSLLYQRFWLVFTSIALAFPACGPGTTEDETPPEVATASAAQIAARYDIRAIPPLPGANASFGYAINDDGDIAGASTIAGSAKTHAIRWTPGHALEDLGTLADNGYSAYASGINNRRQVAANCGINNTNSHACIYVEGLGLRELAHLDFGNLNPSFVSYAAGTINDAGQIAGFSPYLDANFNQHNAAVRWEGTRILDLSPLGALNGTALNDLGWMTGSATAPDGREEAMIYNGTKITVLGVLPKTTTSVGFGINHWGGVAGTSILPVNSCPGYPEPCVRRFRHAFLYTSTGGLVDLGTLGGSNSTAYAIDDNFVVVGKADTANGTAHAFAWANGARVDLNTRITALNWTLTEARGINAAGQIVGNGTHNGVQRGFILTPR